MRRSCLAFLGLAASCTAVEMSLPPVMSLAPIADRASDQGLRLAVLTSDYFVCDRQTGDVYRVPRGYVTDYASVPSLMRPLFNPYDRPEAAVVHDYLFAVGEEGGFETANRIFLDHLAITGISDRRIWLARKAIQSPEARAAYGAPEEWSGRFADPETGKPLPAPSVKPKSARVTTLPEGCRMFRPLLTQLRSQYGSDAKAEAAP